MSNYNIAKLSYEDTGSFSPLVVDYQNRSEKLLPFINEFPSIEAIKRQIERKETQVVDRNALVEVLQEQYGLNPPLNPIPRGEDSSAKVKNAPPLERGLGGVSIVQENILKLKDQKTFTICTAHQPNIFTGYLYFMYKIVHAINLAKECAEQIPGYHFVPIYFIGSEDNDIEEIGAFNFKGKKYQWQPNETGACGRFSTQSLVEIRDKITAQFGTSEAETKLKEQILAAYDGKKTLSQATQHFVHSLFGEYGLISLDADDKRLKQSFKPVIRDEMKHQSSHHIVSEHNIQLSKNYRVQVEPRELNLFFLKNNIRERIEKDGSQWKTVQIDQKIDALDLVDSHPEYFSPNVILRPIYQEMILPSVAFIGGGSEIAYWCELKSLFEYHNIKYPILFVRNSLSIIYEKLLNKISNLGLEESFKVLEHALKEKSVDYPAYIQLLSDLENIEKSYESAISGAAEISPNLKVSAEAHLAKIKKINERLKTKYRSHIKRQFNDFTTLKLEIANALYPEGQLQERTENYLELVCRYRVDIIPYLMEVQPALATDYLMLGI